MASSTTANNEVDPVQAKIDLSLSFAHDLVTSWLKPSSKATASTSTKDPEKEIEEYLRRPPRLGVGAPIPVTSTTAREVVQLKNRLVGKNSKRPREDDDQKKGSSDEDESRAGAIKKKARTDPFGGGKKGKKHITSGGATVTHQESNLGPLKTPIASGSAQLNGGAVIPDAATSSLASPFKQDKTTKRENEGLSSDSLPKVGSSSLSPKQSGQTDSEEDDDDGTPKRLNSPTNTPETTTLKKKKRRNKKNNGVSAVPHTPNPKSFAICPPESLLHPPSTPFPSVRAVISPLPPGIPLLNLTGPPLQTPQSPDESPSKKRRKRRKKNKNPQTPATITSAHTL